MYYYQPNYYYQPIYYPAYAHHRQTAVNPDTLYQSATQTKVLMKEASMVLDTLASSKDFDTKLMSAAQISDMEEVKRLIRSIGVTSDIDIHINPDDLRLEFKSKQEQMDCCKLLITLRWN